MMNILAIETTGKYGSAAVIDESGSIFEAVSTEEMNHLRGMIDLIDEAIRKAGITKKDLTHAAASIGPGSFTGIRIGVTTARIMGQMLDIPCIGVSSLEGMAEGVLSEAARAGSLYVAPLINARRHQTYAAVYETKPASDCDKMALTPVVGERQYMIEELLEELSKKPAFGTEKSVCFTGDGIDSYEDIIKKTLPEGSYTFASEDIRYQLAGSVAVIALRKARAGQTVGFNDLMPEYMRLAEAEQRLKAGTLSDRIKKPVQI